MASGTLGSMTTQPINEDSLHIYEYRNERFITEVDMNWQHPLLEIFKPKVVAPNISAPKLYLVPSTFGDEFESEFAPQPTSALDLPDLKQWTQRFACNVIEIWAGKRSPQQLARQCHYTIFTELVRKSGSHKEMGHIRKIHIQEPLDGICEATVTVRFEQRLRSMLIRFEGIDQRWLCTALTLL